MTKNNLYSISFFCVILAKVCLCQTSDRLFSINNLHICGKEKTVIYSIKNNSDKIKFIQIGAEEYKDTSWVLFCEDIFKEEPLKTNILLTVNGNSEITLKWIPYENKLDLTKNKSRFTRIKLDGVYRFVIMWGNDPNTLDKTFYTDCFHVGK